MICARCNNPISKDEDFTWTIIPGRAVLLPTCYDDRLCKERKKKPRLSARIMEMARRFVLRKGG